MTTNSSTTPRVSIIVSTYNWPQALELVLKSMLVQTFRPHEIIVADDGSREETKSLIAEIRKGSDIPIIHVWQEDEGFRLAKIRNKAIAKASGEYIIQIDGDCILGRHFVEDHLTIVKPNRFLCGRRILLDERMTAKTLETKRLHLWEGLIPPSFRDFYNTLRSRLMRKAFAKFYGKKGLSHVIGCNMSFWRSDLLAINGYNEAYEGWGAEDDDLVIRLLKNGVEKACVKGGGTVYHLHHGAYSQERVDANRKLLQKQMESVVCRVELGVDQYLP
ncbi:glycosyltransferase family 2 protein [Porphyromonas sp.]|uniref:glycosyltransferase family 2 protein n=1 Tax=Porphyromonas sp. TaxID=1924944 RepID=UPI0026DB5F2F|nr:glycosyltransferase family 2 protein [Porphyromonas sp.]MDO4771725.1 glycosyltransferase family 2 protein [Porphyromonas sp.]